ncbi:MAG TPA: SPOR domain-containing protein [Blastocatellia bacterium]
MHAKTFALLLLMLALSVQSRAAGPDNFTLQVAAFADPRAAQAFVEMLARSGETAFCGEVEIPERGRWLRIFIGSFATQAEARRYGQNLIARAIIKEFIVKPVAEIQLLTRPRTVNRRETSAMENRSKEASIIKGEKIPARSENKPDAPALPAALRADLKPSELRLPSIGARIPKPDPAMLAFKVIAADSDRRGGLWVSGDREEALARLRWIAGVEGEIIEI